MRSLIVLLIVTLVVTIVGQALPQGEAQASNNSISISPDSGQWNYPQSFTVKNDSEESVTIHWFLDCWDHSICTDSEGEETLVSGQSFSKGLGDICSKWQLDLNWKGSEEDWDWGGIAEKNRDCDRPTATPSPTPTGTPPPTETPTEEPTDVPTITPTATPPVTTEEPQEPEKKAYMCPPIPNTLGLEEGKYEFFGWDLVEVKNDFIHVGPLGTEQPWENKTYEVENGIFSFNLKVEKDPLTGEIFGFSCDLVQDLGQGGGEVGCPECVGLPHQDEVLVEYVRRNDATGMGLTAWVCDFECDGQMLIVLTEPFKVNYGYRANEVLEPQVFANQWGTYYVYHGPWDYAKNFLTMEDGSIENMITLHRAGVKDYGPCVLTPDSANPWQFDGTTFVLFPGQAPEEVEAHMTALQVTPDQTVTEMFSAFRAQAVS